MIRIIVVEDNPLFRELLVSIPLRDCLPALQAHMADWCARLRSRGDLAANLLAFIAQRSR